MQSPCRSSSAYFVRAVYCYAASITHYLLFLSLSDCGICGNEDLSRNSRSHVRFATSFREEECKWTVWLVMESLQQFRSGSGDLTFLQSALGDGSAGGMHGPLIVFPGWPMR